MLSATSASPTSPPKYQANKNAGRAYRDAKRDDDGDDDDEDDDGDRRSPRGGRRRRYEDEDVIDEEEDGEDFYLGRRGRLEEDERSRGRGRGPKSRGGRGGDDDDDDDDDDDGDYSEVDHQSVTQQQSGQRRRLSPTQQEQEAARPPRRDRRYDPLKPTIFDARSIPFVLRKLHNFVKSPVPSGGGVVVRCFIERKRDWQHKLHPIYRLYADHEDGTGRLLMAARKLKTFSSSSSHYAFSTSVEDLFKDQRGARSRHFLGKLRAADSKGAEYVLYDAGATPNVTSTDAAAAASAAARGVPSSPTSPNDSSLRRELLAVTFSSKAASKKNPRRFEVAVPKLRWRPREVSDGAGPPEGDHDDGGVIDTLHTFFTPPSNQDVSSPKTTEGILHTLNLAQGEGAQNVLHSDKIAVLHLRESKYDPLSSCLVDFKARANVASVKNFQLVKSPPVEDHRKPQYYCQDGEGAEEAASEDAPHAVLLQMGKVGKDCFNMDLQYPLSILQAFAICIARFDTTIR